MEFIIGIDNSKSSHFATVVNRTGDVHLKFELSNDIEGYLRLQNEIKKLKSTKLVVGMELTHGPIMDFLKEKNISVYSINPLKIKRYKETRIVSGNKTDEIDSYAIAKYIFDNQKVLRPILYNSDSVEQLKRLDIGYERLLRDRTKYLNRLRFVLDQYLPLYAQLFSNINSKTLHKMIIKYPSYEELMESNSDQLRAFFNENHFRGKSLIERKIQKISEYSQVVGTEHYAASIEAITIAELLIKLNESLNKLKERMCLIKEEHILGKLFDSLPGAGELLSSKLLSIFGDNKNRFSNAKDMQCLFGTSPRNYQSGNYQKVIFRRACNKRARHIMWNYSFSSLRFSEWARSYYDQQRAKGKRHSSAIRALGNKWLKIIFQMWKNGEEYDSTKFCLKVA